MRDLASLTPRGRARRFGRVLREALDRYPLKVRRVRFVSLDSKPVFRVDTDTGPFAAKFHDPSEHELSQLSGELEFLRHVAARGPLRVETPQANRRGKLVTEVSSRWLPEPAHVALCTWLPGRLLRDSLSPRSYRLLGECAARLHRTAGSFRPSARFRILTNDRVFYWDAETLLTARDRRHLTSQRQERFRAGARFAGRAIRRLWRTDRPIVIHNDLHPSNIKVARGELSVFDFEDITWGFPPQDVGTAMYYVRFREDYAALRDAFRAGYEEIAAWPCRSDRQLDALIAARLLMLANYVSNYDISPGKYLPRFARRIATLVG